MKTSPLEDPAITPEQQARLDAEWAHRLALFEAAYDRNDPILRAYFRSKISQPEDARDVQQDFYKDVIVNVPTNKLGHLPYLMRRARYAISAHYRKQRRQNLQTAVEDIDAIAVAPTPCEVADSPEAEARLRAQFFESFPGLDLTEKQRDVLWMHGRQGLTLEEISAQTGVPVSTLHDWIAKGRNEIAKHLQSR